MNWQTAFQTFATGMAALASWFLYDLVKEFKSFKSETRTDVSGLKRERDDFKTTVRNSELSIAVRVTEMQKLHSEFNVKIVEQISSIKSDVRELRDVMREAKENSKNYAEFLQKALKICHVLDHRLKKQEADLKAVKIQVGELMILKSVHKNGE